MSGSIADDVREAGDWLLRTRGSTRTLALIRMGLVANCWARWSNDHVLFRDLTPETMVMAVVFFFSSTLAFVGLFTRLGTIGLAIATNYFVYVKGHAYGFEPYTHHHTTLLANACFLLALSPCGKSLSVDRYLEVLRFRKTAEKSTPLPSEEANLWAQRLMALLVASIYFWGGLDKLNLGFLSGARMTHYLMYFYTGPQIIEFPGFDQLMAVSAVLTAGLELALAVGMFSRKWRRWLVIPGLLLHGVFYFALSVFTFTTTMWVLYLAFFDSDEVDRTLSWLVNPETSRKEEAAADG